MTDRTCIVERCTTPTKRAGYCYSHYMRNWRYGTPTPTFAPRFEDIRGQRFGTLTVTARTGSRWTCECDCGETRTLSAGDLNRTRDGITCGTPGRHLSPDAGYTAAHDRVRRDRGSASTHACIDCDQPAAHWSYMHDDPDERTQNVRGLELPYSLDPDHYAPRCVSCHKRFDLGRAHHVAS